MDSKKSSKKHVYAVISKIIQESKSNFLISQIGEAALTKSLYSTEALQSALPIPICELKFFAANKPIGRGFEPVSFGGDSFRGKDAVFNSSGVNYKLCCRRSNSEVPITSISLSFVGNSNESKREFISPTFEVIKKVLPASSSVSRGIDKNNEVDAVIGSNKSSCCLCYQKHSFGTPIVNIGIFRDERDIPEGSSEFHYSIFGHQAEIPASIYGSKNVFPVRLFIQKDFSNFMHDNLLPLLSRSTLEQSSKAAIVLLLSPLLVALGSGRRSITSLAISGLKIMFKERFFPSASCLPLVSLVLESVADVASAMPDSFNFRVVQLFAIAIESLNFPIPGITLYRMMKASLTVNVFMSLKCCWVELNPSRHSNNPELLNGIHGQRNILLEAGQSLMKALIEKATATTSDIQVMSTAEGMKAILSTSMPHHTSHSHSYSKSQDIQVEPAEAILNDIINHVSTTKSTMELFDSYSLEVPIIRESKSVLQSSITEVTGEGDSSISEEGTHDRDHDEADTGEHHRGVTSNDNGNDMSVILKTPDDVPLPLDVKSVQVCSFQNFVDDSDVFVYMQNFFSSQSNGNRHVGNMLSAISYNINFMNALVVDCFNPNVNSKVFSHNSKDNSLKSIFPQSEQQDLWRWAKIDCIVNMLDLTRLVLRTVSNFPALHNNCAVLSMLRVQLLSKAIFGIFEYTGAISLTRVFRGVLAVITTVWNHYRAHFKVELVEIVHGLLFEILQSPHCNARQQMDVIHELISWLEVANDILEMYLNFDNEDRPYNAKSWKLFEGFHALLCQLAQGTATDSEGKELQQLALKALCSIMRAVLDASAHAHLMQSNDPNITRLSEAQWEHDDKIDEVDEDEDDDILDDLIEEEDTNNGYDFNEGNGRSVLEMSSVMMDMSSSHDIDIDIDIGDETMTTNNTNTATGPTAATVHNARVGGSLSTGNIAIIDNRLDPLSPPVMEKPRIPHVKAQSEACLTIRPGGIGRHHHHHHHHARHSSLKLRRNKRLHKEQLMFHGVELANTKSLNSCFTFLESKGMNVSQRPEDVIMFIRTHIDELDRVNLGDYLGDEGGLLKSSKVFMNSVRDQFISGIHFDGKFVDFFREVCERGSFQIPGEGQKIERIMDSVGRVYKIKNPQCPLSEFELCQLALSAMWLQSLFFKSDEQMSRDKYCELLHGTNPSVEQYRMDLVKEFYDSISAKRMDIETTSMDGMSSDSISGQGNAADIFKREMKLNVDRAMGFWRKGVLQMYSFSHKVSEDLITILVHNVWADVSLVINSVLKSSDSNLIMRCLDLLQNSLGASIFLDVKHAKKAFASTMAHVCFEVEMFGNHYHHHRSHSSHHQSKQREINSTLARELSQGNHLKYKWYSDILRASTDQDEVNKVYGDVHVQISRLKERMSNTEAASEVSLLRKKFRGQFRKRLNDPQRRLVREGVLTKVHKEGKGRKVKYQFFLFNDLLVYAKRSIVGKLHAHQQIPLNTIRLKDIPDHETMKTKHDKNDENDENDNDNESSTDNQFAPKTPRVCLKNAFWILSRVKRFPVCAESFQQKVSWMQAIGALASRKSRTRSIHVGDLSKFNVLRESEDGEDKFPMSPRVMGLLASSPNEPSSDKWEVDELEPLNTKTPSPAKNGHHPPHFSLDEENSVSGGVVMNQPMELAITSSAAGSSDSLHQAEAADHQKEQKQKPMPSIISSSNSKSKNRTKKKSDDDTVDNDSEFLEMLPTCMAILSGALSSEKISDERKLRISALFKQIINGDCPSTCEEIDHEIIKNRHFGEMSKMMEWAKLRGLSSNEAKLQLKMLLNSVDDLS
eukprot:TRINITY_DN187_c1_g4_i2.p1 TRINITY_DN187_c1_g4~~TRINITY_DN187_c1_g4_i2.p1  ORF type:complete len:1803 (-),score=400.90 TRINITY_DN187_c1_g4_i2:228-5636(-)